jgi:catechol 2,3-dioxygenase-like lactoylglutathione lyase family enzyme
VIEFFSAVLLVSKDPDRLAKFYRDVLGIALEDEQHGDLKKHYGCTMGDLHFAIHPVENFDDPSAGVGSVKLAFTVFDMKAFVNRLRDHGVQPLYPPKDAGFALMTAVRDPDGNLLEFTQLGDAWFRHLAQRRRDGHDVLRKMDRGRRKRVR